MSDTAFAKVEDAFADALRQWPTLSGWSIVTERSTAVAADDDEPAPEVAIYTVALSHDNSDEHGQTQHTATIEFEVTSRGPGIGLGRANLDTIAHIVAALGQDRSMGGRIEDWQEIDTARPAANGKDLSTASLQISATFYTSRTDWFTLIGQGGATF